MFRALIIFITLGFSLTSILGADVEANVGDDALGEFQGLEIAFIIFVVDLAIDGGSARLKIGRGPIFCTCSLFDTVDALVLTELYLLATEYVSVIALLTAVVLFAELIEFNTGDLGGVL